MAEQTLDIGIASRPCPGFVQNGDRYRVEQYGPVCLVTVIDGLGHGGLAAEAADAALECMHSHSIEVIHHFYELCDEIIRGTRGVVAGIAVIDLNRDIIEYSGVGNIEAVVYYQGTSNALISTYGVVGIGMLPKIVIRSAPFLPGAMLLMFSDGISSRFRLSDYYGLMEQSSQFIADMLMRDWNRANDDATIVVVRREL